MPDTKDPFGGSSPLSSPGGSVHPDPFGGSSPLSSPGNPSPSGAPRTPVTKTTDVENPSLDSDSDSDDGLARHELPTVGETQGTVERVQSPPLSLDEAFRSASASQTHSTPASKNVRNAKTSRLDNRKLMEVELGIDLGKKVKVISEEWARSLYANVTLAATIADFLRHTPLYNLTRKRWVRIRTVRAGDPKMKEEELYEPFQEIIAAILGYFEERRTHPATAGATREVVDSHKTKLAHDNDHSISLPDICIKASGFSFEQRASGDLGYYNIGAVFDVKTEENKGSAKAQAKQLGVYTMQMAIHQPNREHSRSLIITETSVRLVHFDRSGCYATPYFDIHDPSPNGGAHIFIRWVLGLSSYHEKDMGLDTAVQWSIDDSGRKHAGTITVKEWDGQTQVHKDVAYDIDMTEPPFVRPSLCGRGTVIWNASHGVTKEKVMIKDSWRTETRVPESEYLRKAKEKGIQGVVEMLACQDNCAQTADYRPEGYEDPAFHNRVKSRTVLKKHGPSIWYFRTRLQLLRALLDVIIAHQELFKSGILHRDISMQNIVLGCPSGGSGGPQGVLLDLDMAIWATRSLEDLSKDERTGFLMYQSYYTICSGALELPSAPHDYLDDLECLFYVTLHLTFGIEAPGKWKPEMPYPVQIWLDETNLIKLAAMKRAFVREKIPTQFMAAWWGGACKRLVEDFGKVVSKILGRKMAIYEDHTISEKEKEKAKEKLAKEVESHFGKVKSAFEKAIAALVKEGPSAEELEPYPQLTEADAARCTHFPLSGVLVAPPPEYHPSVPPLHNFTSQGMKRGSEEMEDEGAARKRLRNYRSPLSETLDVANQTAQGEGEDDEDGEKVEEESDEAEEDEDDEESDEAEED